eukprot:CAMPEP_0172912298 /NCGR_PEP_ID=MMETSP1075-20121228/188139_1 /TAXON_ID=2916 /ORGANISM="Ceratium fusus, Strain PA161109" /LENGTH=48 /DNA_ID= /DNA_START= /DNA_END= /DNA_ORIENTATION=
MQEAVLRCGVMTALAWLWLVYFGVTRRHYISLEGGAEEHMEGLPCIGW